MLNCKCAAKLGLSEVIYQFHYPCSSTSLQFTKEWAAVFFRSFQVGPCDSWCLFEEKVKKREAKYCGCWGAVTGIGLILLAEVE